MKKKIKLVCFGGGTGLSGLLSGLKRNEELDIFTVVTMFDSGGNSGELRDKKGILPPGDIIRCILAQAPDEDQPTIRKNFTTRLAGNYTGGNIFLLGAEKAYDGDYQKAIDETCKNFSVKGKVYPVALKSSDLCAVFTDCGIAQKETNIDAGVREGREVGYIYLYPAVPAHEPVLSAIRQADVICIGPGSFYTSILPNFLPAGVKQEFRASRAPVIFVSNLMTEGLGMKGYTHSKLTEILEDHIGRPVDRVIVNTNVPDMKRKRKSEYRKEGKSPFAYKSVRKDPKYVFSRLWLDGDIARHDSGRLSHKVSEVIDQLLTPR